MSGLPAAGTNRAFFHEVKTSAAASDIWRLWTDVSSWKEWDKGLKDAELDGSFGVGARGRIVPLSGPTARFYVTEYMEGISYAFETSLPLARLEVRRSFVSISPTVFRHDVTFKGFLGSFWSGRFGPGFRQALPPTMEAIAELAERNC
ncbi:MAG: SRPBCC family protein [Pseudomonadota bacterium]